MALKLEKWIDKPNIASEFSDDLLNKLGAQVCEDYEIDLASRKKWEDRTQTGLDLAMQLIEQKTWPWPNAANVKYPLIAFAAVQFHARAYPEIIRGNDVVKGKVIGEDKDGQKEARAQRISKHMSYQVLEEMVEWEEDTDRLLMMLPIIGTLFKKTYYCSVRQRNVSCLRKPFDIVVHNDAKSIDDARRITDQGVFLYRNDIYERKANGNFLDIDITYEHDEEAQQAEQFLEQHRWEDFDKDGYGEPYIVTVHKNSQKVVRIAARYDEESVFILDGKLQRIEPVQYFTKFSFLPSFDGSFYDVGFGQLLMPLNEAINTNLNQLLDAGTLANVQGGLMSRGIKIKGGQYRFQPGEWKQTDASPQDLANGFLPLPAKEPSNVLYMLLQMLIESGKQLASVSDIMTGEQNNPNEPATSVLARIEQGMKVFNGIHKRVYRSLKSEYQKLAKLNKKYMSDEQYFRVLDIEQIAIKADYNDKDIDVVPVADPAQGTDIQRMAKAQALMGVQGGPGIDNWEIIRRFLEALNVANIEKIQPDETAEQSKQPPPPDPKLVEIQGKLEIEKGKLLLQAEELEMNKAKMQAEIDKLNAEKLETLARAEAAELGPQLQQYMEIANRLHAENMQMQEMMQSMTQPPLEAMEGMNGPRNELDSGGIPGMEEQPDNGGGIPGAEGLPAEPTGEIDPAQLGGDDLEGNGL